MTPQKVLAYCREKDVKAVDIRFTDLLGTWRHLTIPVSKLDEDMFEDGLGFDGANLRGWQGPHEAELLVVPQADTALIDPFTAIPTLVLIGGIQDPADREDYSRDPRHIARKAVQYLKSTGIGDAAWMGPHVDFFVFDDVRFDSRPHEAYFHVDSREGQWNCGRAEGPNLGDKLRHGDGYGRVPPSDNLMDLRGEMMQTLTDCGVDVESHHHESASGGQCRINMKCTPLVKMADQTMLFKYVVKNMARRHQRTVTFMPKPLFGDNGSGMDVHLSLWKGNEPLFAGTDYAGLSDLALYAIGGILRHAPALAAITNPTTNSYKRLFPGGAPPVTLSYSQRNRSAGCRVPMSSSSPKAKRIEFRCPDPSTNPYLAFSAILLAAIDGIQNKLDPGDPLDIEWHELNDEQRRRVSSLPTSLDEALACLERDHAFLLRGNVFTEDVLRAWIDDKRKHEADAVRMRPHPHEFTLYFDA